jgi:hypothetical protein
MIKIGYQASVLDDCSVFVSASILNDYIIDSGKSEWIIELHAHHSQSTDASPEHDSIFLHDLSKPIGLILADRDMAADRNSAHKYYKNHKKANTEQRKSNDRSRSDVSPGYARNVRWHECSEGRTTMMTECEEESWRCKRAAIEHFGPSFCSVLVFEYTVSP